MPFQNFRLQNEENNCRRCLKTVMMFQNTVTCHMIRLMQHVRVQFPAIEYIYILNINNTQCGWKIPRVSTRNNMGFPKWLFKNYCIFKILIVVFNGNHANVLSSKKEQIFSHCIGICTLCIGVYMYIHT